MQEIVITPTSLETFGFDPHFGSLLLSKKIERQVKEYGQIVISMGSRECATHLPEKRRQGPNARCFQWYNHKRQILPEPDETPIQEVSAKGLPTRETISF